MPSDVGQLIKELVALDQHAAELDRQTKAKRKEAKAKKEEIRLALGAQGLTSGRNQTHSATVTELLVPNAQNWNEFYDFVYDNRFAHLLHRRLSVEGCRELWASGSSIPGVEAQQIIDISLRKV